WHLLPPQELESMRKQFFTVSSYAETWKTIDDPRTKIIIAGSGMITGGRVLTYLRYFIEKPQTTVLLTGFQAEGTRGRQLQEGASEIKIFGKYLPVSAEILSLHSVSRHADNPGLPDWTRGVPNSPEHVYLMPGDPTAAGALRVNIKDAYHWPVHIPHLKGIHEVELSAATLNS